MTNKKVLVIGGNGFIGRNLVKFLASQPEITIYSFDLGKPLQQIEGVKYIEGDFFDDYLIKNAIKGIDVVIHSLSTINPGNSNSKYMQGYSRDFLQTVKLCGLLVEQKSNMIFLSSGGTVYGEQIKQPINETISPKPINHYGGVKLCIENVIQIFNTQLHSKMRIARISNPYGPGQDYNKGVGFIDATIKKALAQEVLEIWGDGENIR
ncbi:MAG: NAD-dependent epimerase/dehydratase family protein, partial [Bacilli bacterium]